MKTRQQTTVGLRAVVWIPLYYGNIPVIVKSLDLPCTPVEWKLLVFIFERLTYFCKGILHYNVKVVVGSLGMLSSMEICFPRYFGLKTEVPLTLEALHFPASRVATK